VAGDEPVDLARLIWVLVSCDSGAAKKGSVRPSSNVADLIRSGVPAAKRHAGIAARTVDRLLWDTDDLGETLPTGYVVVFDWRRLARAHGGSSTPSE
jgi:hypothetical protein